MQVGLRIILTLLQLALTFFLRPSSQDNIGCIQSACERGTWEVGRLLEATNDGCEAVYCPSKCVRPGTIVMVTCLGC